MNFYYANKFQLLIGLENSRDQCFKTKTKTKILEQSRDQDRGLKDYKTVFVVLYAMIQNSRPYTSTSPK